MKNNILLGMFFFLVLVCATTNGEEDNIKYIGPLEMVAPSENQKAMIAYNKGTEYMYANKLREAEKFLKEAIKLDPLFVDAMDHLGRVYRMQNRLIEAEEMYLKSIEINDKNLVPYQNLAVVYRLQNKLNDAFKLYDKMIDIKDDNPEPYYGIGELFYMVGDYENSIPFFDKAMELYMKLNSSLVYDVFYYKGMIYFEMENYDEALKYLQEAKKGNPNDKNLQNIIDEIINKKI